MNNSLTQEVKEKSEAISQIKAIKSAEEEKRKAEQQKQIEYEERAEKTLSYISAVTFGCIIIPIASTIINFSGLFTIPAWTIIISAILILVLPALGFAITSKKSKIKSFIKKRLINNYKMNDYKKTL